MIYYLAMKLNAKKIKSELDRAGMSKKDLAKKIGMSIRNVDMMLFKKTTKLVTIERVARVFDLDPKDLLI